LLFRLNKFDVDEMDEQTTTSGNRLVFSCQSQSADRLVRKVRPVISLHWISEQ